eukprot:TRINITY_DN18547_c0_g1_i1.p1 TRINITY_DN18547_c0_g1~~TRINITY_DN18547_c0_g1_i1.p1  ORF type:complete len:655 (+),score=222.67 TRINITY_DN18547_c0_g1_i1:58-2022(+)
MSSSLSRNSSHLAGGSEALSRSGSSQQAPGMLGAGGAQGYNMSSASLGNSGLQARMQMSSASMGSSQPPPMRGGSMRSRTHAESVGDAVEEEILDRPPVPPSYSHHTSVVSKELPPTGAHPRETGGALFTPLPSGHSHIDPSGVLEDSGDDDLAQEALDVNAPAYDYDDLVEGVSEVHFGVRGEVDNEDYLTESTDIDVSKLSVGERLYYIGCGMERMKQERLRQERENKIVSELSAMTAKPMITPFARKISTGHESDFAEKTMRWRNGLERKRKAAAAQQTMMDQAENLQRVEVSKRSRAILEKREKHAAKYKGPVSGWNKHFARYQTKKNIMPDREVFTPNINKYSSKLERDGGIGDRLFEEAKKKEGRLRHMMERAAMQEIVDPVTGCAYFTPSGNVDMHDEASFGPRPGAHVSAERTERRDIDTVVTTLLAKGQESQNRLKQSNSEAAFSFKPQMNKKSQELVNASKRRPLYDSEKFSNRQRHGNEPVTKFSGRQSTPAGTPAAATPSKSPNNQRYSVCTPAFIRRNEKLLARKQERVRDIKQQQQQREMEECTFTPSICRQSEDILTGGSIQGAGSAAAARRSRSAEPVYTTVTASAHKAPPAYGHTPPASQQPQQQVTKAVPQDDPYVSTFEKEMMSILDEWQKLEDV